MIPMEILHEIVATEHRAREEYNEVLRRQEGFDAYLEKKTEKMRREYFAGAEAAVAEAEGVEIVRADAEIAELDRSLNAEMEALRRRFEENREALAERLFDMVVGLDADA